MAGIFMLEVTWASCCLFFLIWKSGVLIEHYQTQNVFWTNGWRSDTALAPPEVVTLTHSGSQKEQQTLQLHGLLSLFRLSMFVCVKQGFIYLC